MKIDNDILIPELARLLSEGKEVRFTPSGVSMRPFIEGDRDSVILAPLARPARRGDILLVRVPAPARYVLHRLIRIERDASGAETLVLQGDGNLCGEERCRREDVIGIVMRIETPSGKRKAPCRICFWRTQPARGRLWHALLPCRPFLLKLYRHTILKWRYK